MTFSDVVSKVTSRKFLVAIGSIVAGIIAIYSGKELPEVQANIDKILGSLLVVLPAIVYIFTEGKVDAAKAASTTTIENITTSVSGKK